MYVYNTHLQMSPIALLQIAIKQMSQCLTMVTVKDKGIVEDKHLHNYKQLHNLQVFLFLCQNLFSDGNVGRQIFNVM